MVAVERKRFLRIQPSHDPWSVGMERSYGNDFNEMTRNWRASSNSQVLSNGSRAFSNEVFVVFQNKLVEDADRSVSAKTILETIAGPLKAMHDALLALREYVFEEIRRREFGGLPSRQTCLYLCPDRPECVKYWWETLATQGHNPGKRIWEVEATGSVFLVPAEMLTLQTMSVEEWEALSRAYWSPHKEGAESDEVLFAGDIQVLAERNKSEFGIA